MDMPQREGWVNCVGWVEHSDTHRHANQAKALAELRGATYRLEVAD